MDKHINFLVVDDSVTALATIEGKLRIMGFTGEIFRAHSGQEAYTIAKGSITNGNEINYIICDLHMPDSNGLDMLNLIDSDKDFPKIPILMLTAEEDVDIVFECLRKGATGYSLKKLDKNLLLQKITEIWEKIYPE